ncbi:tripartite tricarboxylate transporter TctB family protein [Ventrimonas sp. CLA-AP-H27]|uniref:Tripartite tricarboxylate transporter TctB family protein n=1 Tax=Ventrimonas faecis TaxID=3133170 RepID=A0ABV1HLS7_9FIRM
MKKIKKTYIAGVLCLILAGWIAWQTSMIPERLVSNEPGPKMFPYFSAAGIAIFAVLSMIFDAPKEANKEYLNQAGWKRMAIIMGEVLGFCIAMHYIGFWISSVLGMLIFIWTLKGEKKINRVFAVCFSVGLGSLCYFGFTRGFHIPLPVGEIWNMLGINML